MAERVLITGITGQDGSFLAERLLEEGCRVAGLIRTSSTGNLGNVEHLRREIEFFRGDLLDEASIEAAISHFKPNEIYNLGAEAAPFESFRRRVYVADVNHLGALRIFGSAMRLNSSGHGVKVYQASSSEMYGAPSIIPQNETTPFKPNNPYGVAKLAAHEDARIYREGSEGLFVACGILFNHESPRRGMQYVTRKISVAVACIANKVKNPPLNELSQPIVTSDWKFHLGNLYAERDWGYSKDYVRVMPLIIRRDVAEDFVIATNETHTVREFVERAFSRVNLNWQEHVVTDPVLVRPLETGPLMGDASKANRELNWYPSTTFEQLVNIMVDSDLAKFS